MSYTLDLTTNVLTVSGDGLGDIKIALKPTRMELWSGTSMYQSLEPGGGHWEYRHPGGLTAQPGGIQVNASGHLDAHEL
jgi:hypothetical protein